MSEAGVTELAVCCEIQLRIDESRRWAWPLYLAKLRFDLKCPVVLLVLTPDPAVLRWCAKGFHLGHPGLILCPLGIGPDDIDRITDPEEARNNLELAVLSALAHGDTPQGLAILDTVVEAMNSAELDKACCYTELLLSALKGDGKHHLEHLMMTKDFEYTSDFALRLIAQGETQGEAKSILLFLKARGIPVTQHARDRIRACTDPQQFERWIERAALIENIDELFAEEG
ncbi:hypothetical protein ABGB12_26210 [Actinocorallia sp. B10E7]|uniref:hypothetical protein n=1 Tax=Actinocorallia sp. B10E7 TaxID=3153558 RepID=UPI00325CEEF9